MTTYDAHWGNTNEIEDQASETASWEEARAIFADRVEDDWNAAFEELRFCVPDWGWGDRDHFLVPYGATEYLLYGNADRAVLGQPLGLLDRRTRRITWVDLEEVGVHLAKITAMTPVGEGHPRDRMTYIVGAPLR